VNQLLILFNQDDDNTKLVQLQEHLGASYGGSAFVGPLSKAYTTNLYLAAGTRLKIGMRLLGSYTGVTVIELKSGDLANQRMTYITGYKIA